MTGRLIVSILLGVFLLVPNGLAVWMLGQAKAADQRRSKVAALSGEFAESGLFVAEGKLHSPSGDSLKSLHFEQTCVAFRTKFDLRHTVTDSDGEQEDKRLELFEERHQVKGLEVDFGTGKGLLDIQALETFYKPKYEELDELPEYVPDDRLPTKKYKNFWFEVYENILTEGQAVTVVGQMNQLGLLTEDPELGPLIVFPGTKDEYLESEASSSKTFRLVAYILIAASVVVCLALGIVLKFLNK